MFASNPGTGWPCLLFGAHPDVQKALARVLPSSPERDAQYLSQPPAGFTQLALVSRTACVSSGYVAEQRSNPFPILAIIGAIYVIDTVAQFVDDYMNDQQVNFNGRSFMEDGFEWVFRRGADLFGVDPKYSRYVDVAADVTNFAVGLVSGYGLVKQLGTGMKGIGAIETIGGRLPVQATALHYSLWARAANGATWAEAASRFLAPLDTLRWVEQLLLPYEMIDAAQLGTSVGRAVGSENGTSIVVIFDTSGSMNELTRSGEKKIDWAKRSLKEVVSGVSPRQPYEWAMFTFRAGTPNLAVPFRQNPLDMVALAQGTMADGNTPLARTMELAAEYAGKEGRYGRIQLIILSDGQDTCGGDPAAVAKRLADEGAIGVPKTP